VNRLLIPAKWVQLISPADRKRLGIETEDEMTKKIAAKNERELQGQIMQYLGVRGIEALWHRTDKRSHATLGWPDITFGVMVGGIPCPCGWEVKFGNGTLTKEQNDMLARLQARPNCWRIRIIRSFIEAVDELREMGL
jgi:hypothetical protein